MRGYNTDLNQLERELMEARNKREKIEIFEQYDEKAMKAIESAVHRGDKKELIEALIYVSELYEIGRRLIDDDIYITSRLIWNEPIIRRGLEEISFFSILKYAISMSIEELRKYFRKKLNR